MHPRTSHRPSFQTTKDYNNEIDPMMSKESASGTAARAKSRSGVRRPANGRVGSEPNGSSARMGAARSSKSMSNTSSEAESAAVNSDEAEAGTSTKSRHVTLRSRSEERFAWNDALHQLFLSVVFDIGLEMSSPRVIFDRMCNNPEMAVALLGEEAAARVLSKEGMTETADGQLKIPAGVLGPFHVKSHLQRFRKNIVAQREKFVKQVAALFQAQHAAASEVLSKKRPGRAFNPILHTYPFDVDPTVPDMMHAPPGSWEDESEEDRELSPPTTKRVRLSDQGHHHHHSRRRPTASYSSSNAAHDQPARGRRPAQPRPYSSEEEEEESEDDARRAPRRSRSTKTATMEAHRRGANGLNNSSHSPMEAAPPLSTGYYDSNGVRDFAATETPRLNNATIVTQMTNHLYDLVGGASADAAQQLPPLPDYALDLPEYETTFRGRSTSISTQPPQQPPNSQALDLVEQMRRQIALRHAVDMQSTRQDLVHAGVVPLPQGAPLPINSDAASHQQQQSVLSRSDLLSPTFQPLKETYLPDDELDWLLDPSNDVPRL